MTPHELASKPANEVRRSEKLMHLYKQFFRDAFSFEPQCAPCTFKTDFSRFQEKILGGRKHIIQNQKIMATKATNFILKRKYLGKILTYRMDGRPYRVYGKMASDEFLANFLTFGNEDQIKERKQMFEVIPENWTPDMKPWNNTDVPVTQEDEKSLEKSAKEGTLNLLQLRELTVSRLKIYAKDQDIKLTKTRKDDIIEEILEAQL